MAEQKKDINAQFAKMAEKAQTSSTSASAVKILTLLRDKGKTAAGMTVSQLQEELGTSSTKKLRDSIRQAQDAAVVAGDLVACFNRGRNVKEYVVVPADVVVQIDAETLNTMREGASDFSFAGNTSGRYAR